MTPVLGKAYPPTAIDRERFAKFLADGFYNGLVETLSNHLGLHPTPDLRQRTDTTYDTGALVSILGLSAQNATATTQAFNRLREPLQQILALPNLRLAPPQRSAGSPVYGAHAALLHGITPQERDAILDV